MIISHSIAVQADSYLVSCLLRPTQLSLHPQLVHEAAAEDGQLSVVHITGRQINNYTHVIAPLIYAITNRHYNYYPNMVFTYTSKSLKPKVTTD